MSGSGMSSSGGLSSFSVTTPFLAFRKGVWLNGLNAGFRRVLWRALPAALMHHTECHILTASPEFLAADVGGCLDHESPVHV